MPTALVGGARQRRRTADERARARLVRYVKSTQTSGTETRCSKRGTQKGFSKGDSLTRVLKRGTQKGYSKGGTQKGHKKGYSKRGTQTRVLKKL